MYRMGCYLIFVQRLLSNKFKCIAYLLSCVKGQIGASSIKIRVSCLSSFAVHETSPEPSSPLGQGAVPASCVFCALCPFLSKGVIFPTCPATRGALAPRECQVRSGLQICTRRTGRFSAQSWHWELMAPLVKCPVTLGFTFGCTCIGWRALWRELTVQAEKLRPRGRRMRPRVSLKWEPSSDSQGLFPPDPSLAFMATVIIKKMPGVVGPMITLGSSGFEKSVGTSVGWGLALPRAVV